MCSGAVWRGGRKECSASKGSGTKLLCDGRSKKSSVLRRAFYLSPALISSPSSAFLFNRPWGSSRGSSGSNRPSPALTDRRPPPEATCSVRSRALPLRQARRRSSVRPRSREIRFPSPLGERTTDRPSDRYSSLTRSGTRSPRRRRRRRLSRHWGRGGGAALEGNSHGAAT